MDNARWTKMLKLATGCPCDISPRWLLEMRYGDYTGADLARELHIVLGNTVRDPIHERMRATAGGCEGNGIQLWRGPFREFEGGDVVVQNHMGVQFPAFKQCKDIRNLSKTLDDWFGVASKACQQRDDECLRTMSVGILPPDLKADGNKRVMLDLGTSDNVFKYANQQVAHMRSEQLADHPGKHVQPLTQPQQQQQADNNMPALADTGLVVNQDSLDRRCRRNEGSMIGVIHFACHEPRAHIGMGVASLIGHHPPCPNQLVAGCPFSLFKFHRTPKPPY